MKRILLVLALVFGIAFLVIQFFQPDKNNSPVSNDDLFSQVEVPTVIQQKLKSSCYDCHSNQTKYPWYNNVAPVSWMIANHVKEGTEELNFSNWGAYSKRKQISKLSEISEVITEKSMPLPSYLLIHKKARFSPEDVEAFTVWTDQTIKKMMEK